MNKLILASFMALIFSSCKTVPRKEYKENINNDFTTYNNLIINQDFEKATKYMLPEFFEIIPKEKFIKTKIVFNTPDIEFVLSKPQILNIRNLKKYNKKYYVPFNYSQIIKMKIKKNKDEEIDEKKEQNLIKLTLSMLQAKYGQENVKYNSQTKFYEITTKKEAFAVSVNGINDWKFIVYDNKENPILKKLIPEELLKR